MPHPCEAIVQKHSMEKADRETLVDQIATRISTSGANRDLGGGVPRACYAGLRMETLSSEFEPVHGPGRARLQCRAPESLDGQDCRIVCGPAKSRNPWDDLGAAKGDFTCPGNQTETARKREGRREKHDGLSSSTDNMR
jgi:hypothetical protein